MLKYLDGTVLPYVNLGNTKYVEGEWKVDEYDYGTYQISGTADWDSEKSPTAFTNAYKDAGWTIDENTTDTFKATDPSGKIHISAGAKSTVYYNTDTTLLIKASIDETYDLKNSTGAWDSDVLEIFNDKFGAAAPYVYLGMKYPTAEFNGYENAVVISGNEWNDSIISDAMETLKKEGYSLVFFEDDVLIMKGNVKNSKDVFEITIKKNNYPLPKITMSCQYIEDFNPTGTTDWTDDIKTQMTTNLDNHILPYLYLGTKNPTYNYDSSFAELDIRGVNTLTTDQVTTILNNSKDVFTEDDDWTIITDAIEDARYIKYQKEFEDHCIIKINLVENASYGIVMECTITKALVRPDTAKDWSENTKKAMQDNLNRVLPYVYLNTTDETATWDEDSSTLTIEGGTWLPAIGDHVQSVYSAVTDGNWSNFELNEIYGNLTMIGDYDGDKYKVSVSGDNGNAIMTITYIEKYVANDAGWDETTLDYFEQYLDKHVIPYIYLRNISDYYYYQDAKTLSIMGGEWDEGMITAMKAAYKEDEGWSVMIDNAAAGNESSDYKVRKDYGDGCILEVELKRYSEDEPKSQLTIHVNEYYDSACTESEWSETAKTTMEQFDGLNLPYIYLGTKNPVVEYDQDDWNDYFNQRLTVKGGGWSDEIITKAKNVLTGYTCYESKNNKGKTLIAYKKDETKKKMQTIFIFKDSSTSLAYLYVWESPLSSTGISTTGTWDDDIVSAFKSYTKDDDYMIPYLSFGSELSFSNDTDYATITTNDILTHERSFVIYEQLLADNWSVDIENSGDALKVTATKTLEDQSKISLVIDDFFGGNMSIRHYDPFVKPDSINDWDSSVKSTLNSYFGHTIPYFYIGADHPTASYDEYQDRVEIKGNTWDDQIFTNAIDAFNKDADDKGNSYWTYMYDYSAASGDILIASRTYDDGKKMTVKIHEVSEDSYSYPLVEVYCR